MRGSLRPPIASASTWSTDSLTRRMRSLMWDHDLSFRPRDLVLLPVQVSQRAVEQPVELVMLARHAGQRQTSSLPELVVIDLRDRGAETVLQLRLRRQHMLALPLQRPGIGEVQVDSEDADVPGAHAAHDSSLIASLRWTSEDSLQAAPTEAPHLTSY